MLFNKLNDWLKLSMRLVLATFICGFLFFSSVYPAGAATSSPNKGEANLNRIQAETDKVGNSDASPRGLEETIQKAQEGTNEVQGGADKDKMVDPSETSATTVKDQAASFLDNLTN